MRGLRLLIESNLAISKREEHTNAFITPEVADTNITFLRTHTQSWLAVLFNIYGTMNGDKRTVVGGVISAWLDIAGEQVRRIPMPMQFQLHNITGNLQGI